MNLQIVIVVCKPLILGIMCLWDKDIKNTDI